MFRRSEAGKLSVNEPAVYVPCGRCIGCRLEFSRQWAVRSVHESKLHKNNTFITLTYSDENLPKGGTLVKSDFQKFMKRLRKHINAKQPDIQIKYLMCGEYGSDSNRPHYHAILFNYDFKDKKPCLQLTDNGQFESPLLNKLWPFGFASIGEVNFESCAYVARYCVKKFMSNGEIEQNKLKDNKKHYPDGRLKEYLTMSRPLGS